MIDTAQKMDRLLKVEDLATENGKPVDVRVVVALQDLAGARFIKGQSRCEKTVAAVNANEAAEFSKRQATTDRYK